MKTKLILLIMFVAGLAPLLFNLYSYNETKTTHTGTVEGILTQVNERRDSGSSKKCSAYVSYVVDNVRYEERTWYCSSTMDVGESYTVHYNPQDPTDTSPGFRFFLIFISVVWYGVLGLMFYLDRKQNKKDQKGKEFRHRKTTEEKNERPDDWHTFGS